MSIIFIISLLLLLLLLSLSSPFSVLFFWYYYPISPCNFIVSPFIISLECAGRGEKGPAKPLDFFFWLSSYTGVWNYLYGWITLSRVSWALLSVRYFYFFEIGLGMFNFREFYKPFIIANRLIVLFLPDYSSVH